MPRLVPALLAACALAGCANPHDSYEITEALESNTCGSRAQPLADGTTYRIEIKTSDPTATWQVLPNGSPVTGTYNSVDGTFHFSVAQTLDLDGADAGTGLQCTVIRTETISGTLIKDADAGTDDGGVFVPITAQHAIDFAADSNGRCAGATVLGPFDILPCEAKYTITGVAK